MSQSISQVMSQQMRMEQRLTPQLIQSMAILQKPVADLEAYINEALETNPALEVEERAQPEPPDMGGQSAASKREDEQKPDASFSRLDKFSRSYEGEWDDQQRPRQRGGVDDYDAKLGAMANTPGRSIGLSEHLLEQWTLVEADDDVRRAGEAIINHLEPDGYLRVSLEEVARSLPKPVSMDVMSAALAEVQKSEPAGVGARDLKECLLLQIAAQPGDNQMERILIERHLDDIAQNRLPQIAKETGYSLGEINEAIRAIRTALTPHPGYLIGDRQAPIIRPDLLVDYAETGGGLTVQLARGNLPKLKINDEVAAMVKGKENGRDTRDFARKQVEAAAAIIDAVQFRQSRLLEVGKSIVEKQRDFFDSGPQGLKVFRMSDLATELGCDPSTISRTVADKYVQTPHGIYPLRYFFTGGTESESGESIGWDRVKTRVKELVDGEDRANPLNDDQIAAVLSKEGIALSRRTVAKYRQQLDIPTARQRKTF